MKPTEFLQQHRQPDNPSAAANGDQQPPAEPEPRKSWMSEAFDWALAVGGFVLLHNYFYPSKKDD